MNQQKYSVLNNPGYSGAIVMTSLSFITWTLISSGSGLFFLGGALGCWLTGSVIAKNEGLKSKDTPMVEKANKEIILQRSRKSAREVTASSEKIKEITEKLLLAIATGEIIQIKYFGGSDPGGIREITPVRISNDLLLDAFCVEEKRVKTFRIDRISFDLSEDEVA